MYYRKVKKIDNGITDISNFLRGKYLLSKQISLKFENDFIVIVRNIDDIKYKTLQSNKIFIDKSCKIYFYINLNFKNSLNNKLRDNLKLYFNYKLFIIFYINSNKTLVLEKYINLSILANYKASYNYIMMYDYINNNKKDILYFTLNVANSDIFNKRTASNYKVDCDIIGDIYYKF